MTPHTLTAAPQDRHEPAHPQDDSFLAQFDDEALERALKAVNWNPMDVAQFLRSADAR